MEPFLRVHPGERPIPLGRPAVDVNLNMKVLISTPHKRPTLLKDQFSGSKLLASQKGCIFLCTCLTYMLNLYDTNDTILLYSSHDKPFVNCMHHMHLYNHGNHGNT